MGKNRFAVNPFPPLELTPGDISSLQEFAYNFLDANLQKYEEFIADGTPKVDPTIWKLMKTKEGTKVYVERNPKGNRTTMSGPPSMYPALLMVGNTQGTVEDCMFGACSPTVEHMRIKASYVEDISGGAVLATIEEPTMEEPFRSLTVRWIELDIPGRSTGLILNRDYVYVEFMKTAKLSNGEVVGIQIYHSVEFPQTHELPNRVRANFTVCGIFRQVGPGTVEVYGSGVLDPAGDMIKVLVVPSMATGYLTTLRYAHCGQMRKLAHLLEQRYADAKKNGTPNHDRVCVMCSEPITRKLGDLGRSSGTCKLCFGFVCRSCKLVMKISFVTPDMEMEKRKVVFCSPCLNKATLVSASDVAREQIQRAIRKENGIASSGWGTGSEPGSHSYSS